MSLMVAINYAGRRWTGIEEKEKRNKKKNRKQNELEINYIYI